MTKTRVALLAAAAVAASARGDHSEWRGPDRNGVLPASPPLLEALPADGLPRRWEYAMPAGGNGNLSTPVGAGDRVYAQVSWKKTRPIEARRLDRDLLRRLGEFPRDFPADLAAAMEAARLSEERRALDKAGAGPWAKAWAEKNVPEARRKTFGRFVEERLTAGAEAAAVESLGKLAAAAGKSFPNQAALETWLAAEIASEDDRRRVAAAVVKEESYREDTAVCLGLDKGELLWKREYPAPNSSGGANNTPCLRDGRLYFVGCGGTLYALDARTGAEVWTEPEAGRDAADGSVTVVDGKVITLGKKGATAVDAATGKRVWRNEKAVGDSNSASLWKHQGRTYLVAGGPKISCLDPADGRLLWQADGSKWTTPAVAGDTMVVMVSEKGPSLYRLSPEGATPLASQSFAFRACSPAADAARVYALARQSGVCFDAATGKVLWENKGNNDTYASPLVADGKIVANHRNGLIVYDAATGRELFRASVKFAECVSVSLVGGRVLARSDTVLACYDLRKPAP